MKRLLLSSVAGAGLLVFGLTAAAQDRDRDNDSYRSERDARFNDQHWRGRLFDNVREDVQHVQSVTWPGGGDEYRLSATIDQLNQLQAKLADHVYDEAQLDQVIDALGKVASYNRMASRDRDILNDDIARLRNYREHHADWDR
jgi:hypothetical protein